MNWAKLIKSGKLFNHQPISHWQDQADRLVMDMLLQAANSTDPKHSIIGYLARKQLLEIAKRHNRELYKEEKQKREAMQENFGKILARIIG